MAEELKKLDAAWRKCEARIVALFAEVSAGGLTSKNLQDWLAGAQEELVAQVDKARAAGTAGTTLDDFLGVGAVKSAWTPIEAALAKMKSAHDRTQAAIGGFKALHAEAIKIAEQAEAEVAARKKKVFDSKSIPALEKLAKTIRADLTTPGKSVMSSVQDLACETPKKFSYDTTYRKGIAQDIANGRNRVKVVAEIDTATGKLSPRHLAALGGQISRLSKDALGACDEAVKAHQARDAAGTKKQLDLAIQAASAAQDIAEDLNAALKRVKSTVASSKDGVEILRRLDSISKAVAALLAKVQSTQKQVA